MVRRAGGRRVPRAVAPLLVGWLLQAGGVLAQGIPTAPEPEPEHVGFVRPGLGVPGSPAGFGGLAYPTSLRPMIDQRWDSIVRQELDAGCGPAAMATFYTYYLDIPIGEEEMYRAVKAEALRRGRGRDDIRSRGYSLADLKRVAESGRLVTAAFKADIDGLPHLRIPVISHINIRGYGHFVVIRGVVGDRVVVADPNFGNMTYPLGQFGRMWSGVMLALGRPREAVAATGVDPELAPTVQEIDYRTFQEGPQLDLLPFSRFDTIDRSLIVSFRQVVPNSQDLLLLKRGAFVTEFNRD